MPNDANVDAPISLVGPGRSGTSLLAQVFHHHPDCSLVGETVNTIFDVWDALEFSSASGPPLMVDGVWLPDDERSARAVRAVMSSCYPSARPCWFHKPIGVPRVLSARFRDPERWDAAARHYWRVMRTSFPRARWLTVLRHPCDVVLSSRAFWGFSADVIWWHTALQAAIVAHESAPEILAIDYEDFVHQPERAARAMLAHAGLPFVPEVMGAFEKVHVGSRPDDEARRNATRRGEWRNLDPAEAPEHVRRAHERAFARFGRSLTWPEHFATPVAAPAAEAAHDAMPSPKAELERLTGVVQRQNAHVDRLNAELVKMKRELARLQFNAAREAEREAAREAGRQPGRDAGPSG